MNTTILVFYQNTAPVPPESRGKLYHTTYPNDAWAPNYDISDSNMTYFTTPSTWQPTGIPS